MKGQENALDHEHATKPRSAANVHPLTRNDSLAARLRWWLLPWIAYAWRYREDHADARNPGNPLTWTWGSVAYWIDELLERLPSGALWPPMPAIECDCDYCRGVPGVRVSRDRCESHARARRMA